MPLFLIGFMAAGKTSVGRAIAEATGRVFVDLDDEIAKAGESVAVLVARDEAEFRRREQAALTDLIRSGTGERDYVLATGGGAAAYGTNLEHMRLAGCVIALGVDVSEARRRAAGGPARPLLANAEQLAAMRAPAYRRAHAVVDTTGRSVADVVTTVDAVERVWSRLPSRHRAATIVALGDRSYPVIVSDTIDTDLLREQLAGATRIEAITDANVARSAPAMAALRRELGIEPIVVAAGEATKSIATYERSCNELIARGIDRSSAILAIGGGVVGDLAGFVAASLFRGIRIIQVPTTILAMCDAAIGGKTAVDTPAGKNLIGAFWQPQLVMCGLDTLTTLPARERRAGFGELWKYALLDGPHLWKSVASCAIWAAGPEAARPPAELRTVIERALAYKAAVVGRDEREVTGHRALLNLGHTVGHAIESESGMLHGEAVGLGLIAACRVSAGLCDGSPELAAEVTAALAATGLPTDLDRWLTENVLGRLGVDKKRVGATLKFIVVRGVGSCEPIDLPIDELRRFLRSTLTT